jgi:hypothetical protein
MSRNDDRRLKELIESMSRAGHSEREIVAAVERARPTAPRVPRREDTPDQSRRRAA